MLQILSEGKIDAYESSDTRILLLYLKAKNLYGGSFFISEHISFLYDIYENLVHFK
jgi:hypothetical protein